MREPTKHIMYVDDNMMVDIHGYLTTALAASIEALFVLLGFPDEAVRKSPLTMDKYYESLCSYMRAQLARLVNTRHLNVSIPDEKRNETLRVLQSTWHKKRKSFTLREGASLLGVVQFLSLSCSFGRYLYIALQHSIYVALKFNTQYVFTSPKFERFTNFINSKDTRIASFFKSKTIKEVWNLNHKFFINKTMRAELDLLERILASPADYAWSVPIRHLIPSDYEATVPGDACLDSGGAFCDEFQFWYYVSWPDCIRERTLKGKGNRSKLISINCLEYVIIILSYNAVLDAIELLGFCTNIPHPKSKILCDNKTADTWTRKIATSSIIGKNLNRIFCSLLVNQPLGIDSEYLPGEDNDCADHISRLKDSLTSLFQKFPKLAHYRRYHPAPELLSIIYNALLNNSQEVPMPLRLKGHFTHANDTL